MNIYATSALDDLVELYLLFHNIFFAGTAKLNIHPRLVWLCLMDISFDNNLYLVVKWNILYFHP